METLNIAAIDLGASSGRVMLATYGTEDESIQLREVHRFKNQLQEKDGHTCWNLQTLEQEILCGLKSILEQGIPLHSIGIDTWGVDYVLLDKNGNIVGPTYAYRDHRTHQVMPRVFSSINKEIIYNKTGIQFLTFNTLFQLKAMVDENPSWLSQVQDFVMIPDYLNFRLTGKLNREYTNATTTQLVNVNTDSWDADLIDYLGLPIHWFGNIRHPGHEVGRWHFKDRAIPVMSVASHDTASAVISAPLFDQHSAYLCSGTWSLMGLDTQKVHNSNEALTMNITNEGGIDGHYRVLKNIMGLWLFNRLCAEHQVTDIPQLVEQAQSEQAFKSIINPNDESFLNPDSMVEAIQQYCANHNQPVPQTTTQLARCIFDSLAMLYRKIFKQLEQLQQTPISTLHIVGGGSQNHFLNQLCADVCNIEVITGPIEASVLGNIGVQLMALDRIPNVQYFRKMIEKSFPLHHFYPNPTTLSHSNFESQWQQFNQFN